MTTSTVASPTSRLRLGHARVEVTPPVGIYHRMWGAARHDRATGVHRPLIADVLTLAPLGGDGTPLIRVHLDAVGLSLLSGAHLTLFPRVMEELRKRDLDVVVFGGGTIPEADVKTLKEQGVAELFTPGASLKAIGQWLEQKLDAGEGD